MRVTCGKDPELEGVQLAALAGPLDAVGSVQFWEAIEGRLTAEAPSLLVDMSDVPYVSSAGIGMLVRALTRCQAMGGGIAAFGGVDRVRQVFQICGLEAVLNTGCATAADARTRLRASLG